MKLLVVISLVSLASTATVERTPSFKLITDRSANGSPIIDVTFPNGVSDTLVLREFDAAETTTGTPKYYAMSGGAEGSGATSSGRVTIVPTPSSAFTYKIHYNARPAG